MLSKKTIVVLSLVFVALSCVVLMTPSYAATVDFIDLSSSEPAYPYIKFLTGQGIIGGYPDGTFQPNKSVTRAEAATLLVRVNNLVVEQPPSNPTFTDVSAEHWAYQAIEASARAGLLKGFPDGTYRPEEYLDRTQAAVLLLRLTTAPTPHISMPELSDVPSAHWGASAIAVSLNAGIMTLAPSGKYEPEQPVSRSVMARGLAFMLALRPETSNVPLVGILLPKKGSIYLQKDGESMKQITEPIQITSGSHIIAGKNGEAEIQYPDGSGLLLQAGTELVIKESKGHYTILRDGSPGTIVEHLVVELPRGRIFGALATSYLYRGTDSFLESDQLFSKKEALLATASQDIGTLLAEEEGATESEMAWWMQPFEENVRVEVDMPWGVAGVRGTFWMNDVTKTKQITNVVIGSVEVTSSVSTESISKGKTSSITSTNSSPTAANEMTNEEKKSWIDIKDWVMDRASTIQIKSPLITPAIPLGQQREAAQAIVLPPAPPVVDEVMKAFMESTSESTIKTIGHSSQVDTTQPRIISTDPKNGANNVVFDKDILVTFNENVLFGSNYKDIKLKNGDSDVVISTKLEGSTLTITPQNYLIPGTVYSVLIPSYAIVDIAGNKLSDNFLFSFTTSEPWDNELVSQEDEVVHSSSMVLDELGQPHISYFDRNDNGCLKYTYKDQSGWHTPDRVDENTIENEYTPPNEYNSIKLDKSGKPQIAYFDRINCDLIYAFKDDFGWNKEIIDSVGYVGENVSLFLDFNDMPHISYSDDTTRCLKYAYKDDNGWHKEFVYSDGSLVKDTFLALNASGIPHISFYTYNEGAVKHAYKESNIWMVETVEEVGAEGGYTSLALDISGYPHLSYYDSISGEITYAYKDSLDTQWHTIDICYSNINNPYSSLTIDNTGRSYISLYDARNNLLKFGYLKEDAWVLEKVDSGYDITFISLALDASGNPNISYISSNDLKYAYPQRKDEIPPVINQTDPEDAAVGIALNKKITITFNENILESANFTNIQVKSGDNEAKIICQLGGNILTIAPISDWSPETTYTVLIPEDAVKDNSDNGFPKTYSFYFSTVKNWIIRTIDCNGTGLNSSMALDVYNRAHIGYYDNFNCVLKYAYMDMSGQWHVSTVDDSGDVGNYNSIILDKTGNPHISYYDNENKVLKYTYKDDNGWYKEVVDNSGYVGRFGSLALDSNGNPHISYYDDYNRQLKYAFKDYLGWHCEIIDSTNGVGTYTSLKLDSLNMPHISYCDNYNNQLKYIFMKSGEWQEPEVVDSIWSYAYTSLVLDSNGSPHIAYQDDSYFVLKYAYKDNATWHKREIGNGGYCASIMLNHLNKPCISYFDTSDDYLKLASYDNTEWRTENVDNASINLVTGSSSLALDASGNPYISYCGSNNDLRFASLDINALEIPNIVCTNPLSGSEDVAVSQSIFISFSENVTIDVTFNNIKIMLAGNDVPIDCHLSGSTLIIDPFGDLAPNSIYFVYIPKDAIKNKNNCGLSEDCVFSFTTRRNWRIENIDTMNAIGFKTSLAIDSYGKPHIAYCDNYLFYTYQDEKGWQTESVDFVGAINNYYDRYDTSLVLDNNNYPHIAYYDCSVGNLKYTYRDSFGWHIDQEPVDSGWVGMYASLDLDPNGKPCIAYYDDTNNHLKFAKKGVNGWEIETVDSYGNNGINISIAVDSNGQPHISYQNKNYYDYDSEFDLMYVYKDNNSVWHKERVDDSSWLGESTSIALDSFNRPCISYYDNGDLNYAYKDECTWNICKVDRKSGAYSSLSLDYYDDPHICYFEDANVMYAYKKDGIWKKETVDSQCVNPYIALDVSGNPYISYSNRYTGQVRCANLDITPLKVINTDPLYNSTGVPNDKTIIISLNKYIQQGENYHNIVLRTGDTIHYIDSNIVGNNLIIKPVNNLMPLAEYTLYIPAGAVMDGAGNFKVSDMSLVFYTSQAWQTETLDYDSGDVGRFAAISIDMDCYPHVIYFDNTSHILKYIYQNLDGWQQPTAISDTVCDDVYSSVAVEGSGAVHVSYYDHGLKYAYKETDSWSFEEVDEDLNNGMYSSIALGINGVPYISYYDAAAGDLKCGYRDGNNWLIDIVDNEGDIGKFTSIATDISGYPYVSYYDVTNRNLKCAFKDKAGWHVETVDSSEYAGYYCTSMAINRSGVPYISYFDCNRHLRIAHFEGNCWLIENVDDITYGGYFTKVVFDANWEPHISYYDEGNYDLMHAYVNEAGNWVKETVDSGGVIGAYSSITADNCNNLHIIYFDGSNYNLKYAKLINAK